MLEKKQRLSIGAKTMAKLASYSVQMIVPTETTTEDLDAYIKDVLQTNIKLLCSPKYNPPYGLLGIAVVKDIKLHEAESY